MQEDEKSLRNLFRKANVSNAHEAAFIFINSIAFEMGFLSKYEDMLPSDWRKKNYYTTELQHDTCEGVQLHLNYVPVFEDLGLIHGFVNDEEVSTLQINCSKFVEAVDLRHSDVDDIYKERDTFSRLVKDNFLNRLLALAQQSAGMIPFGLMVLPLELHFRIFSYLRVEDLLALSLVNREFNDIVQTPELWEDLFKRDFKDSEDVSSATKSWKELYKEKHVQRRNRQELMRNSRLVFPSLNQRHRIPEPFAPPFPDAFRPIGGDPDRFPDLGLYPDQSVAEAFPNIGRRRGRPTPRLPSFRGPYM